MTRLTDLSWSHYLRAMTDTQDEMILFVLTLILGAMGIDFVLGTIAARINPNIQFKSKEGINGILRKLGSIMMLAYCIPLSALLPDGVGLGTLQLLYLGYLFFELKSIIENLEKLGVDAALFKGFVDRLSSRLAHDKEEKENDNSKQSD